MTKHTSIGKGKEGMKLSERGSGSLKPGLKYTTVGFNRINVLGGNNTILKA